VRFIAEFLVKELKTALGSLPPVGDCRQSWKLIPLYPGAPAIGAAVRPFSATRSTK